MTVKDIRVSPNGAYVNPALQEDYPPEYELNENRRESNIFPTFLRNNNRENNRNKSESVIFPYQTLEVPPRPEHYRKKDSVHVYIKRPDLDQLHESDPRDRNTSSGNINGDQNHGDPSANKLGWINGVYIRTMMNLFGVMLFLRMGWMAGQCGVILALVQIGIATIITVTTTLSMIALCTNGDIGAGGIYSMISRTIGAEAGAIIGLLFSFTNAAFVGLNILGAAESISDIFNTFGKGIVEIPSAENDQRIVGYILLFVIAAIPLISLEFEAKTMMFFFFSLMIALTDYFVGALIPPSESQKAQGFAYWHSYVIVPNLIPRWDGQKFFDVFGVFFPSVTGIFTGASMSADLKDPAPAIIKGTFLAIATTSTTYALIIIFTGFTIVAYATGNPADIIYNNVTCQTGNCPYGLINNYQTMAMSGGISHTGIPIDPLIYLGIFAATLSSALGCYTAAPRIFQAFCEDRLCPHSCWCGIPRRVFTWFARGYGPSNDPRHAYIPIFFIAAIFIAIADVNYAGILISNFYLAAFFLVNITCFHASFIESPSFRPSFKYFNKWVSLVCGIVCVVLMFLFDWISSLIVIVVMILIWIIMFIINLDNANWGSSLEAQTFNLTMTLALNLNSTKDHVKHYRPFILLLTGNPCARQTLVDMANNMSTKYGLLFLGHIIKEQITYKDKAKINEITNDWLKSRNVKAFYYISEAESLNNGVKHMIECTGLGKFRPNILMMGYKNNWDNCLIHEFLDYFNLIHSTLDLHVSLIIFRVPEGHDFSNYLDPELNIGTNNGEYRSFQSTNPAPMGIYNVSKAVDNFNIHNVMFNRTNDDEIPGINRSDSGVNPAIKRLGSDEAGQTQRIVPSQVYSIVNRFRNKQIKGTIDIWWLYDDGGLTLLIPYILKNNHLWKGSKLRIFSVTKTPSEIEPIQISLTQLLQKFRISYSDVFVVSYNEREPSQGTKQQFKRLTSKWIIDDQSVNENNRSLVITKEELNELKDKTNRIMGLRELLLQHSQNATLIAMTLPMPRKGQCSAPLYMSWLEILTNNMPPFLLIRGNQSDVLTFYC